MKSASDAILRTEQASYLDALHQSAVLALSAMARGAAVTARDELLVKMEARAAAQGYPISDPEVAVLLAILVRLARPALVVELGTNIGYGAIVMARAAGPVARVVTIEARKDLVDEAKGYIAEAGLADRIEVRLGDAIAELAGLEPAIDFLYVDCVKEDYPRYLEMVLPKLSPRGVVVADNVLWKGQVALGAPPPSEEQRVRALRAFNQALVSRPELCGIVLPLGDGVALAVKI